MPKHYHTNKLLLKTELKNPLKEYQELCEAISFAESEAKRLLDLYRDYKGRYQEAVIKKNKSLINMLEFHKKLKDE